MHDSNSNFIANCILDCIAIADCILIALRFNYGFYLFQPVCLGFCDFLGFSNFKNKNNKMIV